MKNINDLRKCIVNIHEAAEILGVTPQMARVYIRRGTLIAVKICKDYIMYRRDVERLAERKLPRGNPDWIKKSQSGKK